MAAEYATTGRQKKRLIVCCDGTWMNSDYGFSKSSPFSKKGTLQVPSNVTRISRCFKRRCADGTLQIISYESGVGSGSNTLDSITGGAFGTGLAERVREVYAYLCANYMDGDEIFLVGFSRGAFTARSVSGMIANLGLLTREGVEHFYPIFKDMQNWENEDYVDPFPSVPFRDKPKGAHADVEYRARLEKMGYTRVYQKDNNLIKVKGWHDTALSDRIEHAFQALALDETRTPFSPAVWERPRREGLRTVDLRQVWFPGNHGNCGGGWDDQGIANATLAWMMDQMTSIGVEFDTPSLKRVVEQTFDFYESPEAHNQKKDRSKLKQWAVDPIYDNNKPLRPWALGSIQKVGGVLYALSGDTIRTPGMYKQVDPKTSACRESYLQDTNEKVHSSVRVRLACEGLGLNDESVWTCQALSDWKLKRAIFEYDEEVHHYKPYDRYRDRPSREGWIWKYVGSEKNAPGQRIMPEEPLGPYERYVLEISGGSPNVYDYADRRANRSKRRSRSERSRKALRQGASHTY
ncbi:peptidoglycan binding domain containing protein [Metarhizium guizhouense ARSEF 977]|uniref:Peptidoglycan binding domain containing protein n=1 Tax=Metarhizium guizhouense (strain ARSEF 977) TaxID=1276136 RepID=A0A0B4HFF8_METGA|nr:peptidoglycan binding domain containing protein [Metarhizium guizhouense ARSEF 977]